MQPRDIGGHVSFRNIDSLIFAEFARKKMFSLLFCSLQPTSSELQTGSQPSGHLEITDLNWR